jgi:hypothetical protein
MDRSQQTAWAAYNTWNSTSALKGFCFLTGLMQILQTSCHCLSAGAFAMTPNTPQDIQTVAPIDQLAINQNLLMFGYAKQDTNRTLPTSLINHIPASA